MTALLIFAYNRPEHLEQCLNSLQKCTRLDEVEIKFCIDGVKNKTKEELDKNKKVIQVAQLFAEKFNAQIEISQENQGLFKQIVAHTSNTFLTFEQVIVLEDDIVPEIGFLDYMLSSLEVYKRDDKVGCIHAWNYSFNSVPRSFFLRGADCWGWATWRDKWKLFNSDAHYLHDEISKKNLQFEFDRRGTHAFTQMLKDRANLKNHSWAILWHASLFLNNQYCLHPSQPLVKNIGLDGSGQHGEISYIDQKTIESLNIEKIPVREDDWFYEQYGQINQPEKAKDSFKQIKKGVKRILKPFISSKNKGSETKLMDGWNGCFENWEDATKISDGYINEEFFEKSFQSVSKVLHEGRGFERDSYFFADEVFNYPFVSALLLTRQKSGKALHIIDFGGGLGSTYLQHRSILTEDIVAKWTVVETPPLVDRAKQLPFDNRIDFRTDLLFHPEHSENTCVVFSSVLQYVPDFEEILSQCIRTFSYILIDRTCFKTNGSQITVQKVPDSIYKATYPCRIFDETEFKLNFFQNFDQILRFRSYCDDPFRHSDGFNIYWFGFLFHKK